MLHCGKCGARAIPEHAGILYCVFCGQGHFIEIYDDGSIAVQHYPFQEEESEESE